MAGFLALAVFLYVASSHVGRAATWTDINSCGMPSNSVGCQVGTAINTSDSIQTKLGGSLTLMNGLTVSNPNAHVCGADHTVTCATDSDCVEAGAGSSCGNPAQLIVGGTFRWTTTEGVVATLTEWNAATEADNFLDLSPTALREGFVSLQNSPVTAVTTATINVEAATPSPSQPSYAVRAYDNLSVNTSYSLLAKAGYNDAKSVALRALSPTNATQAWAGYFQGNVSIESPFSLVMGGAGGIDSGITSSLCLGGYDATHPRVCYSEWPVETSGDNQWYDASGYLQVQNAGLNVAIGGSDSNAPFFVSPVSTTEADLKVYGIGQSETVTIE